MPRDIRVADQLLTLTADIISAHVENNKVATSDLPAAISAVYNALASLSQPVEPVAEPQSPAVSVRSSVKPNAITCLECGARQKTLKRHLGTAHALTPVEYREKWNLPASYPMVAPHYAAQLCVREERRVPRAQQACRSQGGGRRMGDARMSTVTIHTNHK
jgi:predicted transcriptional regulator